MNTRVFFVKIGLGVPANVYLILSTFSLAIIPELIKDKNPDFLKAIAFMVLFSYCALTLDSRQREMFQKSDTEKEDWHHSRKKGRYYLWLAICTVVTPIAGWLGWRYYY